MKKVLKLILACAFFALVIYLLKFSPYSYYLFDQTGRSEFIGKFESYLSRMGIWAPVIFCVFYVVSVVFFVPASVPSSIGGLIFGQWLGLLLNYVSALIGAMLTLIIVRFLLRDFAAKLLTMGHFKKLDDKVGQNGFSVIVYLRLMFVPFGYLNAVSGLSKISFKDFFWGSVVGLLPGLAVITFLTGAVKSLLKTYKQPSDFLRADIIIPLALFIFSFFIPAIIKKFRDRFGVTNAEAEIGE